MLTRLIMEKNELIEILEGICQAWKKNGEQILFDSDALKRLYQYHKQLLIKEMVIILTCLVFMFFQFQSRCLFD